MLPYHDVRVLDNEQALLDFVKNHQGYDRTYIRHPFETAALMAKQGTLREIYTIVDYEPLSLLNYDRFFHHFESPRTQRNRLATFTGDLNADPASPGFGLIDLMSVRYLIVSSFDRDFRESLARYASKWRPIFVPGASGRYALYENTDVLPRAYVAPSAIYVGGEDQALEAITAPGFDLRTRVVIEGVPGAAPAHGEVRPITAAQLVKYEPTEAVIESDSHVPGYLILTDTFYPGWQATVDGTAAPILRANYLFRAVALGEGHHVVKFTYAPRSFAMGATITSVTIAIMVLLLAYEWTTRRRREVARCIVT
jgi:hypothetical protein